ncbi:MAG: condensation domain-containing protein, partial [Candidatus Eremiobacteraeota bacterium]|nr:condensation domain-containing protein [Candidatus Eremiobacteraeota bacterium]
MKAIGLETDTLAAHPAGCVVAPLSFAQERIWFVSNLDPGAAAYNSPVTFRVRGRLQRNALVAAVASLPRRHASLRTSFGVLGSDPVQIVADEVDLSLDVHDVSHVDVTMRDGAVSAILESAAREPFDLGRPPLAKVHLVRVGQDDHVMVMVLHHIISDARSYGILVNDLFTLYHSNVAGEVIAAARDSGQYAKHSIEERTSGHAVAMVDREFWSDYLAGAPEASEFPFDHPRSTTQTYSGGNHDFVLPGELVRELRSLAGREGVTLFTVIAAVYAILLMRYGGRSDVVFGIPVANRNEPSIERLVGVFINLLPVRVRFDGDVSFSEALRNVRGSMTAALARESVPFEKVVEIVDPARDASRHPIFQTVLSYRSLDFGDVDRDGFEVRPLRWPFTGRAQNDITIRLEKDGESIQGRFEYAAELFSYESVCRISDSFTSLLRQIVADPSAIVGSLSLSSRDERLRILIDWNATEIEYPADRCVHELFEERVRAAPNAVAIVYADAQLTYGELNEKANRLARHLRSLGVVPDTRVAICVERSLEMIVGLLAVLKAGGAYVPLDPSYPADRLRYMLEDSAPVAVLTHGAVVGFVTEMLYASGAPVVDLERDVSRWAGESAANVERSGLLPEHLAYVIYTSGTTGRPKG